MWKRPQRSTQCALLMSWVAVLWHLLSLLSVCYGYKDVDVGGFCFNPFKPTEHLKRRRTCLLCVLISTQNVLQKIEGEINNIKAGQSDDIKPWPWMIFLRSIIHRIGCRKQWGMGGKKKKKTKETEIEEASIRILHERSIWIKHEWMKVWKLNSTVLCAERVTGKKKKEREQL